MSFAWMIALVGLVVVFSALAVLAGVMWGVGRTDRWRRDLYARAARLRSLRRFEHEQGEDGGIPPEMVVVIMAALEAALGRPIRIHEVRYLRDTAEQAGVWSRLGKLEVMASHAVVRRDR